MKNWIRKHKIFTILSTVLFVVLIVIIFGMSFTFSRLLGNVYEVDNIGANIDKIKIGDTIKYTANGYSDWEVLSINREDNTLDIVSKTSVEDVTIRAGNKDDFLSILQTTADKYVNGKYATSARSVGEEDVDSLEIQDGYWINKKTTTAGGSNCLYYNAGHVIDSNYGTRSFSGYYMPIVTLDVGDSTGLKFRDIYNYSLNGVDEWIIFKVESPSTISIVPKNEIGFYVTFNYEDISDFNSYIEQEVSKFKDNNVISVRGVSVDDKEVLLELSRLAVGGLFFYTGVVDYSSYERIQTGSFYTTINSYSLEYMGPYFGWERLTEGFEFVSSWTGGFVPVVTLNYEAKEKNSKDVNEKLQVGDYVKYSANGYNNWKVLNIDKENNTVDIISSGIVKNITLSGKEDFDNLDVILQEEVNKYISGEDAVAVRPVSVDDFDNLKKMKDSLTARFFLNNKKQYRSSDIVVYSCAVGRYDMSIAGLKYEWSTLADKSLYSADVLTVSPNKDYSYTSGLRPIVTLNLSEVKKDNNVLEKDDELYVKEQNKANQNAKDIVTEEELVDVEFIEEVENSKDNDLKKSIDELTILVERSEKTINMLDVKSHVFEAFIILIAATCVFTLVYCVIRFK